MITHGLGLWSVYLYTTYLTNVRTYVRTEPTTIWRLVHNLFVFRFADCLFIFIFDLFFFFCYFHQKKTYFDCDFAKEYKSHRKTLLYIRNSDDIRWGGRYFKNQLKICVCEIREKSFGVDQCQRVHKLKENKKKNAFEKY